MIKRLRRNIDGNQLAIQSMVWVGILWYFIFCYVPMYGVIMAFKDYDFTKGIFASPFAGLAYFKELIDDPDIVRIIFNTVSIGTLKLLICFPIPIIFALLLNEINNGALKKIVQTFSYFPHFISWVIISIIVIYWLSPQFGVVSDVLIRLGMVDKSFAPLSDPDKFYGIAIISDVWKETGWSAIIYIAAIAGIPAENYEAAIIDGASKLQRIRYITLPSITGAIIIMFLMTFSGIFTGGAGTFEQSMFLGNPINYDKSLVLSYYVLKTGLMEGRFSFATAVGLLNSVVSLILLLGSNAACKKLFNRSLYSESDL